MRTYNVDQLTLIQILQGSGSLIFVAISLVVGLKIISRFVKYKKLPFLFVGIAWTGMAVPWLPDTINFISILAANLELTESAYLFVGNAFLPLFVILWLAALIDLLGIKENKRLILVLAVLISVVFEVIFLILFFTDSALIGQRVNPFQYEFSTFTEIYMIVIIVVVLTTGISFARKSMKSDNPEVKLKGKLLVTAFILFTLGAALDSLLGELAEFTVVFLRLLLMLSAIFFYMGFILPKWAKSLLMREK